MVKKAVPLSLAALLVSGTASMQVSAEELSASEILQQSNEAMLELESYASETTMEQTMPDPLTDGESISITTHSEDEITLDPFAMHQVVTTSTPEEGEVTIESYWTEEGFFTEDPEEGWLKMPEDLSAGFDEMMEAAMASDHVAQAEALGEDMSVEDTGDEYVLTYEGDGEKLLQETEELLGSDMNGEDSSMFLEEFMDQVSFNDLSYEMTIDKDTYYMTGLVMDTDMDIDMDGESMNTTQSLEMSVYNFNGIEGISVPDHVVDEATPMEDMIEEEEGGELPDTASTHPLFALAGAAMAVVAGGLFFFRKRVVRA
ncbi:LPXTG-motif cell wall-anchored protein [Geomicrobium halophilum]|uniref:LPXTG-motif cell wall-anchored protein n=1 Tax=Geomicrobium halophilum TaxID=549000 RepID=A0A841PSV3_9BACL|nr:DUF6612 family protein [Geomicrobium halophilum]MBB6450844.1 LPXTG-motif cell wall-anchored protein [Geomicrobium halophilum]